MYHHSQLDNHGVIAIALSFQCSPETSAIFDQWAGDPSPRWMFHRRLQQELKGAGPPVRPASYVNSLSTTPWLSFCPYLAAYFVDDPRVRAISCSDEVTKLVALA